ncbi:Hypothetical protein PHPALM_19981 [Phytophthora palmivora]|uniref:Uncharacterized protein n=1 Tax=Phytophthora palmivora TaxID=4796 RepID=A0A2P4XG04_9STRA|nr:Hypothetical protein PHPALM_19981 [Phytophthora palmivora]
MVELIMAKGLVSLSVRDFDKRIDSHGCRDNMSGTKTLKGKKPDEMYEQKKPDVKRLSDCDCMSYGFVPKAYQANNFVQRLCHVVMLAFSL